MPLNLMYITNDVNIAKTAEKCGVNRIFVDMEYIGKELRQGGMNTVQNHHTLNDVKNMRETLSTAELLVRCNPIHEETAEYCSSEKEINNIILNGADYIMLPYFKKTEEVKRFLNIVNARCKTVLLFETPEAVENIEEILDLEGIDEVFIGLNDLSLGYHKKFMFELLADGTVEKIALKIREKNIPFGFGGIAAVGKGTLPAEKIIREHYRMFSQSVILSRSFCDTKTVTDLEEIRKIFENGIREIRDVEKECTVYQKFFLENMRSIQQTINDMNLK